MTLTTSTLTRAAGLAAVAGGLLFIGVQINHPHLDIAFVTTTEYAVRETVKILFAGLALAGITGMYLRQVKQTGVLGLLGYLLLSVGLLLILSIQVVAVGALPSLAGSAPGFVDDVFAMATGRQVTGDIGLLQTISTISGITFVGGGLLFGVALYRADILARWAAALLAAGTVASLAFPLLPQINFRLFAIPVSVALIGLGYSLWREQRAPARPVPSSGDPRLDPADAK